MQRLSGEERRAQLLAVAREEFLRTGPDATRIADIAEHAGVNVALIYRHFSSKDELFEAAILEPLNGFVGRVFDQAGDDLDPADHEEFVRSFILAILELFVEMVELFGMVLFSDREAGHDFYRDRVVPFITNVATMDRRPSTPTTGRGSASTPPSPPR